MQDTVETLDGEEKQGRRASLGENGIVTANGDEYASDSDVSLRATKSPARRRRGSNQDFDFGSRPMARRSSAPVRGYRGDAAAEPESNAAGRAQRRGSRREARRRSQASKLGSATEHGVQTSDLSDRPADLGSPSVSMSDSDEGAFTGDEDDGNTSSPTYLVHGSQVLPIGYRKKKQKLLKVSNDSPEWFQSRYKQEEKPRRKRVAPGPQNPEAPTKTEEGDFYIPGGKQKVECRYVTQVSDCSPDWFRTKYSKTLYHPMREDDPPTKQQQQQDLEAKNASARKLSFWEDRPL